jgi:hypothetical protein
VVAVEASASGGSAMALESLIAASESDDAAPALASAAGSSVLI